MCPSILELEFCFWMEILAFACGWGLAWFSPRHLWKVVPSPSWVTGASLNEKGDFLCSCSIFMHLCLDYCQWVTRLNSFSSKWALTGWTKCCPKACPLASEWELLGTKAKSEKKTPPSRSDCGLKGQNKLADSWKDAMMTRRTGERPSILEPNQSSSLCAATGSVGFCRGCTQEWAIRGQAILCPCDFLSPIRALAHALSVLLMHPGVSEPLTCFC